MAKYQPTVSRKQLQSLCKRVLASDTLADAISVVDRFAKRIPQKSKRGTWGYYATRFVQLFREQSLPHSIFAEGNGKLPFYAFSTLPQYTCPGAGDCLSWCYSFRAWRYPAAFFRQLQNTLLLMHQPESISDAFSAIPEGVDVRLYVDGDFDSTERVAWWMQQIEARSDLRVYGYSKSWAELLEYDLNDGVWPDNYTLNRSSGSKWEARPDYAAAIDRLPITRGQFVAVPIAGDDLPKGSDRYESPEYHQRVRSALREQYGKRVVSCPGKCGDCGNKSHWCGDRNQLGQVVIGIGIH